jgi:hypothetical protein
MATWLDYMVNIAAPHSKGNAQHWLRYLSKDIDKCGTVFSPQDIEALYNNDALTLFQRITLRAAFTEGSPTRRHIRSLNEKTTLPMMAAVREKARQSSGAIDSRE